MTGPVQGRARRIPPVLKASVVTSLVLGFLALGVLWYEAEKEVRILCGFIDPGMTRDRAVEALETGNLLRFQLRQGPGDTPSGGGFVDVWSPWTLGSSRCTVTVEAGTVSRSHYHRIFRLEHLAAAVATAGFSFLVGLQLLLASGSPVGAWVWGGRQPGLTPAFRVASVGAAAVLVLAGVFIWERVGALDMVGPRSLVDVVCWALVPLFALSAVGNAASSGSERRVGFPLALVMAGACLLVALSP